VRRLPVLAVIAAGGAIGSVARYGLAVAIPHHATQFPWATFIANVVGCFAIGVLMVVVTDVLPGHRLLRPFLGVGVLGGFTTFSTYAVDVQKMVDGGVPGLALAYLAGTLLAALVAVYAGSRVTRVATSRRGDEARRPSPALDRVRR
jgi:fluoride exporter